LGLHLFVNCVVDPEVNVATPKVFVLRERNVGHGSLVGLANNLHLAFT
jgi:hypothetical protein